MCRACRRPSRRRRVRPLSSGSPRGSGPRHRPDVFLSALNLRDLDLLGASSSRTPRLEWPLGEANHSPPWRLVSNYVPHGGIMTDISGVAVLKGTLEGQIILPEDRGYDEARQVFNAMHDKRPAVIARCASTADVV